MAKFINIVSLLTMRRLCANLPDNCKIKHYQKTMPISEQQSNTEENLPVAEEVMGATALPNFQAALILAGLTEVLNDPHALIQLLTLIDRAIYKARIYISLRKQYADYIKFNINLSKLKKEPVNLLFSEKTKFYASAWARVAAEYFVEVDQVGLVKHKLNTTGIFIALCMKLKSKLMSASVDVETILVALKDLDFHVKACDANQNGYSPRIMRGLMRQIDAFFCTQIPTAELVANEDAQRPRILS